jgi:tyrosyl-tRNA synthetase
MDPILLQRLLNRIDVFPGGTAALRERLDAAAREGTPLRIKLGIDPTRPDLHLGHAVLLRKLRQFQDLGHTAILLIGSFTALIGDPTGRSEARPRLTPAEVEDNARTYLDQAKLVLDFETPGRLEVRHNAEWLSRLNLDKILELTSTFTVGQMLAKEDFGDRYRREAPIYLHEFLYPLMQGYDSVALAADVELGGNDQRFNLLTGRDLQVHFGQNPQLGLVTPLLVGLDGVKKMSKSFGNYVGLTADALTMYSLLEKVPDHLIDEYFDLLTDIDPARRPTSARERQKSLALAITALYHSPEAAMSAQADALNLVGGQGGASDQVPTFSLAGVHFPLRLAELLRLAGLVASNSEGRRAIQGGAVRLDGEKIADPEYQIPEAAPIADKVVQMGKKQFRRLVQS